MSVVGRLVITVGVSGVLIRGAVAMADALTKIPDVEIDPEGTFKYILVRVKVKDGDVHKDIVRGTKSAEYHSKLSRVVVLTQNNVRARTQVTRCVATAWADLTHLQGSFGAPCERA